MSGKSRAKAFYRKADIFLAGRMPEYLINNSEIGDCPGSSLAFPVPDPERLLFENADITKNRRCHV